MEGLSKLSQQLDQTESASDLTSQQTRSSSRWEWFGRMVPRAEIEYGVQALILYIVIITAMVNLTLNHEQQNLWIALLCSCLGILIPQPCLKNKR